MKNQKQFFDQYAADHKFDPLLPVNWYKVSEHAIFSRKVINHLISKSLVTYEINFSALVQFLNTIVGAYPRLCNTCTQILA
jgi:hypothetical protein